MLSNSNSIEINVNKFECLYVYPTLDANLNADSDPCEPECNDTKLVLKTGTCNPKQRATGKIGENKKLKNDKCKVDKKTRLRVIDKKGGNKKTKCKVDKKIKFDVQNDVKNSVSCIYNTTHKRVKHKSNMNKSVVNEKVNSNNCNIDNAEMYDKRRRNAQNVINKYESCSTTTPKIPNQPKTPPEFNLHVKGFKLAHLNIRSIDPSLDELRLWMKNQPFHVLTLSETWLNDSFNDNDVLIPGYVLERNDRFKDRYGGVGMYISQDIKYRRRADLETNNLECIWIEIIPNHGKNFLIASAYRPQEDTTFFTSLSNILDKANDTGLEVFLLGDLNCDRFKKSALRDKMDFVMSLHGLTQLVNSATRITKRSSTLIDVILSTNPSQCILTDVIHTSYSDHSLVYTVLCKKDFSIKSKTNNIKEYRCFKNFSESRFIDDLNKVNWTDVEKFNDCDEAWYWFNKEFLTICNKHCPIKKKRFKTKVCPWLDGRDDIFDLMHQRDYHRKQSTKDDSTKSFHWERYKHLRNKVNDLMKKAKQEYFKSSVEGAAGNCKEMWNILKTILPSKSKCVNIIDKDSCSKKANEFNIHFSNITCEDKSSNSTPKSNSEPNNVQFVPKNPNTRFSFKLLDEEDVIGEIGKLNGNKAPGLDGIGPKLLKLSKDVIGSTLTFIFNLSLQQGKFPNDFKQAKVVPIHKGGDKDNCSNYRPISILSTCSKILEKLIHNQLYNYVQESELLFPGQSGFRPGHSTTTALLKVIDDWRNKIDSGNYIASIFIDLRKAFDTINHNILFIKLRRYGINDSELQWFKSYLTNRRQYVAINNVMSDPCYITAGVPQGSILGPMLFLLFINDMPDVISKCNMEMYADDTLMYAHGTDLDKLKNILNNDLKQLEQWLQRNKMKVNVAKTKVMLFCTSVKKYDPMNFNIYLNDHRLQIVNDIKYLGITIDTHLKWQDHVDNVCKKIGIKLAILRRIKPFLTKDILKTVYNTTVLPLFDYASIVWCSCGEGNLKRLQILQNKAMRIILSAHYLTSSKDLLAELQFMSIRDRILYLNGCMVYKALNGLTPKYLSEKFTRVNLRHSHNTRSSSQGNLQIKSFKTNYGKSMFSCQGSLIWNVICPQIRKSTSLYAFKKQFKSDLL